MKTKPPTVAISGCLIGEEIRYNGQHDARKQSLINAKEEFKALCNESPNCRNKEHIISPMRVDCEENKDKFICYRGLEYKVLDVDKNFENWDLDEIKNEIQIKEKEFQELEEKLNNIKYLKQLSRSIAESNKMDKLEVELDKLNKINKVLDKPSHNKAGFRGFKLSSIHTKA